MFMGENLETPVTRKKAIHQSIKNKIEFKKQLKSIPSKYVLVPPVSHTVSMGAIVAIISQLSMPDIKTNCQYI